MCFCNILTIVGIVIEVPVLLLAWMLYYGIGKMIDPLVRHIMMVSVLWNILLKNGNLTKMWIHKNFDTKFHNHSASRQKSSNVDPSTSTEMLKSSDNLLSCIVHFHSGNKDQYTFSHNLYFVVNRTLCGLKSYFHLGILTLSCISIYHFVFWTGGISTPLLCAFLAMAGMLV